MRNEEVKVCVLCLSLAQTGGGPCDSCVRERIKSLEAECDRLQAARDRAEEKVVELREIIADLGSDYRQSVDKVVELHGEVKQMKDDGWGGEHRKHWMEKVEELETEVDLHLETIRILIKKGPSSAVFFEKGGGG